MKKKTIQKIRELLEYYTGFNGSDTDVIEIIDGIEEALEED